jgi:hypothetical protein
MSEREAFEKWVKSGGGDVMKRDGQYLSSMTRLWLKAYQAATAAERERCALVCDEVRETRLVMSCYSSKRECVAARGAAFLCADAIRSGECS